MLNIYDIFVDAAVYLSPIFFSGAVGAVLMMAWVRSAYRYIAKFVDVVRGMGRLDDKNSVVSENLSAAVLGVYEVRQWQCSITGLMYEPTCPCGYHVPRLWGLSQIRFLIPGGSIGVKLKSNVTFNCSYSGILGLIIEGCKMLSIIYVCSNRRSQFCMKNLEW